VKLAPDGAIVWARTMEGRIVGADASGGAALGWVPSGIGEPTTLSVAKLDADGGVVWRRRIGALLDLALDRAGNLLATGCYKDDPFLVEGVPCEAGVVAAKLGPDGTPLWTAHVDGTWPSIAVTADGTEYAASLGGRPLVLTAISPEGAVRWARDFAGIANGRGDPTPIAADPSGPVAVAGYAYDLTPGGEGVFAVILGFGTDGSLAFRREYRDLDPPWSMAYGPDHEIVLAVLGGTADVGGARVEGAMIVDLAP
jgi:hypothetical protein